MLAQRTGWDLVAADWTVDEIERIDADAELEGVVVLDLGGDLIAEEIRNRLDQFRGRRFVLHFNLSF